MRLSRVDLPHPHEPVTGRPSAFPVAHLYHIVTGAGPTMFVLAPECRRLAGIDLSSPEVIGAHADAVTTLIFGR